MPGARPGVFWLILPDQSERAQGGEPAKNKQQRPARAGNDDSVVQEEPENLADYYRDENGVWKNFK